MQFVEKVILRLSVQTQEDGSDRLQTGWLGFDSGVEVREFALFYSIQTGSGAHQASYQVGSGREISQGVKWPEREVNHSPQSNAEVKNRGAIPPLPRIS
jgi:hypothetical protein